MSFSLHLEKNADKLSPVGQAIYTRRSDIEDNWMKSARASLRSAQQLERPLLINTFPAFLDNLAISLSPEYPSADLTHSSTIAQEHGGERARLTSYDFEQVIAEYHIMRQVLFDELEGKVPLSDAERVLIQLNFDKAIRESVTAFSMVQASARQQFLASLTHDIKSPLHNIQMAVELLMDDLDNPTEAVKFCRMIKSNARKAEMLLNDILDTSVIRSGGRLHLEIEQCDLYEIARNSIRNCVSEGVTIRLSGRSSVGWWSPRDMGRAIDNLLNNALKYGDITRPIVITVREYKERTTVSVHNEGKPIPFDEQETIFQAFRRAEAARQGQQHGWGIGLPLVRGIAEAHGGSITVESADECGTTFTIDVPTDSRPFIGAPTLGL